MDKNTIPRIYGHQSRCDLCEQPFIYGWFKGSKFEKNTEAVVVDSEGEYFHLKCWEDPQYWEEEKDEGAAHALNSTDDDSERSPGEC